MAPLKVAEDTWPDEMWKWEFARDLDFSCILGTAAERLEAAKSDAPIHIINRENYVWLWNKFKKTWRWDTLVYDEASRLKAGKKMTSGTTRKDGSVGPKRTSEFGALAKMRPHFKKVIELTGTPTPKGLIDLWGPAYIADGGERLGTTKEAFHGRWFHYNPWNYTYTPHDHSFDEIMDRMDGLMVSLRQEDYLSLPPVKVIDRWVTLDEKERGIYKRLERDALLEEYDIEAVNSGVQINKLLQLSNGSVYNSEKEAVPFHDAKLKELESIIAEAGGRPVMVAYEFEFDKERILKKFPKARVFGEGKNDTKDWNAGKIDLMLLHPGSGGHGMNFQFGGNIQVWFGLTWSLELYQQFNKRLERRGQKADKVFIYRILARGTYDEYQAESLEAKNTSQDKILNRVRVNQAELRKRLTRVYH